MREGREGLDDFGGKCGAQLIREWNKSRSKPRLSRGWSMNGRRVGFSGSTVRRLTPVRGFYYDVLGFPGYKRYIGASSTYMAASSFLLIRPPSRSFTSPSLQLPARFSRLCRFKKHSCSSRFFSSPVRWKRRIIIDDPRSSCFFVVVGQDSQSFLQNLEKRDRERVEEEEKR